MNKSKATRAASGTRIQAKQALRSKAFSSPFLYFLYSPPKNFRRPESPIAKKTLK